MYLLVPMFSASWRLERVKLATGNATHSRRLVNVEKKRQSRDGVVVVVRMPWVANFSGVFFLLLLRENAYDDAIVVHCMMPGVSSDRLSWHVEF